MRTKTVKMLDEPDTTELHDQLEIINSWLPAMVSYDDDFDVAMDDSNDSLFELHDLLTEPGASGHSSTNRAHITGTLASPKAASKAAGRTHLN